MTSPTVEGAQSLTGNRKNTHKKGVETHVTRRVAIGASLTAVALATTGILTNWFGLAGNTGGQQPGGGVGGNQPGTTASPFPGVEITPIETSGPGPSVSPTPSTTKETDNPNCGTVPKKVNDTLEVMKWTASTGDGWPSGNHDPSKLGVTCDGEGNWWMTFEGKIVGTPLAIE